MSSSSSSSSSGSSSSGSASTAEDQVFNVRSSNAGASSRHFTCIGRRGLERRHESSMLEEEDRIKGEGGACGAEANKVEAEEKTRKDFREEEETKIGSAGCKGEEQSSKAGW